MAQGINDDSFVGVEEDVEVQQVLNTITEEDDDDRAQPGLEDSDDEEDPAVARRRREDKWEDEHRDGLTRVPGRALPSVCVSPGPTWVT